jgi:anti-sigma B factor antagonist
METTGITGTLTELREGNVTIVVFGDDLKHLDESNVLEVGQRLLQVTDSLPHPLLVLDMRSTEFFGSSFIESLFRVWKKLNTKPGARFGIAGLQPYCREVLEVTHLDKLWPLFETKEAACAAFANA